MSTTTESEQAHDLWVVQHGSGPDVLLIGGLGDPVESWQSQLDGLADSFRMTAFDNRGVGRSPLPDGPFTVESMADDAASVLRAAGIGSAHVGGFSGGSVIAQELAIRHPDLVRSLVLVSTWARVDPYFEAMGRAWRWMVANAPGDREFLEAFFVWIYTRRAHLDGTVGQIVEESLAFPHAASVEAMQRTLDAFLVHETADRLPEISLPTVVIAGAEDAGHASPLWPSGGRPDPWSPVRGVGGRSPPANAGSGRSFQPAGDGVLAGGRLHQSPDRHRLERGAVGAPVAEPVQ